MKEHAFSCEGAKLPPAWGTATRRHTLGAAGTEDEITDFRLELPGPILGGLSPRLRDLVRIAGYCFLADESASRGGDTDVYLNEWRRRMRLAIAVSDPDFWSSTNVKSALALTLNFATEDTWDFHFEKLADPDSAQMQLLPTDVSSLGDPGCVLLFSGGADSLCAAVGAYMDGDRPFLASHRSSKAAIGQRHELLEEMRRRYDQQAFRTAGALVNLKGAEAKDPTQRSRPMLYASLGTAIGAALGIDDIRQADNGIVSVNLPITDQAIGARASRSTHPKFLLLFTCLAQLVTERHLKVHNPLWNLTRPETFALLQKADGLPLLSLTHSCAHPRGRTKLQPHCGYCSQCVDRRFGTLAAGLEAYDPAEGYELDIFTQALPDGEPLTIGPSYVRHALKLDALSEEGVLQDFPQIDDCLDSRSANVGEVGLELVRMHKRHAQNVIQVMKRQISDHAEDHLRGSLPETCLLSLFPDRGKSVSPSAPPPRAEVPHSPYYESVSYGGRDYALKPSQRRVMQVMNEAWIRREPPLSWIVIKERANSNAKSMSELFRGSPLWQSLIQEAGARGVYRLNP